MAADVVSIAVVSSVVHGRAKTQRIHAAIHRIFIITKPDTPLDSPCLVDAFPGCGARIRVAKKTD
jgi:hypothetical protein